MIIAARRFSFCLFCLLLTVASWAQRHRDDVLTDDEIEQIRDTAQSPEERLKLYIKFAHERLDALEQSQTDPKVKDHAQAIHDHLHDFLDIYDELDENVDTYDDRKEDLRKALKAVIDADTEFQTRLRALQGSTTASPQDQSQYQFFLTTALNAVDDGAQDHRQLLAEQEEAAKHRKKREKDDPNQN